VRNSAPLRRDDRGRPLWDGRPAGGRLGPHQLLALSAYNPASYDSRYFGPLDDRAVLARVAPVLTAPFDPRD
jgi:type IV secretory pathway protease TraF